MMEMRKKRAREVKLRREKEAVKWSNHLLMYRVPLHPLQVPPPIQLEELRQSHGITPHRECEQIEVQCFRE